MVAKIILTVGLAFDIAGFFIIAMSIVVSPKEAAELAVARIAHDELENNERLPMAKALLRQSGRAKVGAALILFGFVLQMLAVWIPG